MIKTQTYVCDCLIIIASIKFNWRKYNHRSAGNDAILTDPRPIFDS